MQVIIQKIKGINMKNKLFKLFSSVVLVLSLSTWPFKSLASTALSFDPSNNAVNSGNLFSLDIFVTDAIDLYSYQFDITFDPSILAATNIDEGTFLSNSDATFFIPGEIDNTAGSISFTANTLSSPVPGVSGSGILANVSFQAIAEGNSPIAFSNVVLLDSSLNDISATASTASITVNAVPLPAGLPLFLGGIAFIFLRRKSLG